MGGLKCFEVSLIYGIARQPYHSLRKKEKGEKGEEERNMRYF